MLQRVLDNIYKIDVPMRDGALNCLNAYFIQGERNLLIDTGFDREESKMRAQQAETSGEYGYSYPYYECRLAGGL